MIKEGKGTKMSSEQYQRIVNQLDDEIAKLEAKKSKKDEEISKYNTKKISIRNSINKHTSESLLRSKMSQIASCEKEIAKKTKESADFGKSIATKKKRRNDAYLKLQKEEERERKKSELENKRLQESYLLRIDELEVQLKQALTPSPNMNDEAIYSNEEYDVFISHAFEDKEEFVDELVEELKKLNLKIWYDTDKLHWGDSMRDRIDKGLSKSKYGIVVLSPNYIAEHKYWTKAELNGLFQVETINGKTILPIWHNLTKKQVVEYSPIIADKKALTTALMTPKEIAVELKKLFESEKTEEDNG